MGITSVLRKMPIIGKRINRFKPRIEDVLLSFYKNDSKITFIDVGANVGQTIDFITKLYKSIDIYSFEPTPALIDYLNKKYGHFNNIHIEQMALSDQNGQLDFYQSAYSPTNSCLQPNLELYNKFNTSLSETLGNSDKIQVKAITLDSWFEDHKYIGIVDIIKIDTQGFEYNVVKGGLDTLKNNTKMLYFEINYLDFYKDSVPFYKIFELLYNNGFYFYCYLSANKFNNYQILESDVMFVNRKFYPISGKNSDSPF
jgi:FkbM family methyltransferase